MAKKNEVEINIKSTFDKKGVAEAKRATEELSKSTKETASSSNADKDAKTAVEELTKAKKTLSRATATTKKNVEKLIESQEIANIAFEEAKPKVEELAKSYVLLDVATATAKKNVKELADSNKRLASSKREVAQATKQEESAQKKSTQTKSRARSATDQLLASQTMLNKENVRAVQRGNKLNEGLMQLSYIMDDVQYGMRGILNNIPGLVMGFGASAGLAGAVSIAVLAGYKLYEWITKEDEAEKKLAEERKARNEEHAKQLEDLTASAKALTKEIQSTEASESYSIFVKSITTELEKQTDEIREQIQLRQEQVAQANNISTAEANIARELVEIDYASGKIDKYEKNRRIREVNSNLQEQIDARTLTKAQQDSMDYSRIVNEHKIAKGNAEGNLSALKQAGVGLDSVSDVALMLGGLAGLNNTLSDDKLQKLVSQREKTKALIEKAKDQGWAGSWSDLMNKQNLAKFNSQLAGYDNASNEVLKIREDMNSYAGIFANAGVSFNPDLSNPSQALSEYKRSLDSYNTKLQSAEKEVEKHTQSLNKANKTLESNQRKEQYLEKEIDNRRMLTGLRNKRESIVDENEQKEEQEKEAKRIEKERQSRQKEIERQRYDSQAEAIRNTSLQGVPDRYKGSEKDRVLREAFEAGTTKLGQTISQTDSTVSTAEMESVFGAMEQALIKNGQFSFKMTAFVQDQIKRLIDRINSIEEKSSKEIEQLKTGISRAVQQ